MSINMYVCMCVCYLVHFLFVLFSTLLPNSTAEQQCFFNTLLECVKYTSRLSLTPLQQIELEKLASLWDSEDVDD